MQSPESQISAVEAAMELLYFASESGKALTPEIRDPILRANASIRGSGALEVSWESEFLDAYARLAALMAPVSERTLRASDNRFGRGSWLRFLRPAEARLRAYLFGCAALALLLFIGIAETGRGLIAEIPALQEQLGKLEQDIAAREGPLTTVRTQLNALAHDTGDQHSSDLQRALLDKQDGLLKEQGAFKAQWTDINGKKLAAYGLLYGALCFRGPCPFDIKGYDYARGLLGTILGAFLLPMLYGALGTCVYVLRVIYTKMSERSFDPAHTGEFLVRILLGTLSGFTLQWMFFSEATSSGAKITPAILAFLGGYSVELLFSALDRVIATVKDMIPKSAAAAASGAPSQEPVPDFSGAQPT